MKSTLILTILTAGLMLNTGCEKQEDKSVMTSPAESSNKLSGAKTEIQKTAQAVVEDAKETVSSYTAKAEDVAKETVQSYTVKAEEILSEITEPVTAVKEKVATYSQPELMARVEQYKQSILEKKEQLSGLTSQLKDLSMMELLSEKGAALKEQASRYTEQLSALKERYGIYIDKLKTLGVNLPDLPL
ncbi:hypothetical protein [Tichowtungia aerotolerans]|uniref:Uncharacterized protein n=1 Tax=Tichowtungia aerotolerans TaxID=2697043 RepID=A0A6P1M3I6_9BACT|nr:hypothetical protein [Tichowtungia aerotolerans]QHI68662.1 hypothetical protein GT409_04105 [Tichowtungia aerotolerans]